MSGTDPRRATIGDLRRLIVKAQASPAERERLANSPAEVLEAEGLIADQSAIDFLRSMGTADYTPPKTGPVDPNGEGAGEA